MALVPARGGSQGVPGKNLRRIGGFPLVARAVRAANGGLRVDRVIVTTDDVEIAQVARSAGAEVIDRPAELSGATASSESALLHALDQLDEQPRIVVFIQATSPFIDPTVLDEAIRRVDEGECDVVFSAVPTYEFLWGQNDGEASGINHDPTFRPRRQDREPHFRETGAFYVMRADGFREAGHRFFGRVGVAEVDELGSIEIDTEDELRLAEAIEPLWTARHGATPRVVELDVDAVVTDFDGVHTDNRASVSADGVERVTVHRGDGMGVSLLRRAGVPVLILSTETNPVVTARAAKLGVDVIQASDDKAAALRVWAADRGLSLDRVAYLGNDVNDLGCFAAVGWPVAVPDAHPDALAAARIVLATPGGSGAVRELADRVLAARASFSTTDVVPSHDVTTTTGERR
ncbi:acylneuraminate cytidylyltransferase [Homoserinimonas aerilata]|uniref:acylneuraminate cytidylyltransferase n=1 Tax=Homoserinimonas aerilata TaxID=1162970 RepID=UPI00319E0083